jgi:hypothetical protein
MLGLGRASEINEKVMREMAEKTDGKFFHATDQQALVKIFESLSIGLHDDGIDEASLKKLADETGGKYYHIRDSSEMAILYKELADELQSTWTVTFKSARQKHDGTARGITVEVQRGGVRVSDVGTAEYNVRGVVVADMSPTIYLVLLAGFVGLLAVPALLRRRPSAA